jgi:hypothetical protein
VREVREKEEGNGILVLKRHYLGYLGNQKLNGYKNKNKKIFYL